jgi:hypothetical protein
MLVPGAQRCAPAKRDEVLPVADPSSRLTTAEECLGGLWGGTLGASQDRFGAGPRPVSTGTTALPFIAIRYACLNGRDHHVRGLAPIVTGG